MHVAIIDSIGLKYNGNTVFERGLGGSESAVTFMAQSLVDNGFYVDVYCNCDKVGIYSGVVYRSLSQLDTMDLNYDIVISSRSVYPFIEDRYKKFFVTSPYKVLWMHDTFCQGDELLEQLVVEQKINTIFTLSDFHTSYVSTCDHGHKRMFEALKRHIFATRNGVHRWIDEVDISAKDYNSYVFNASVTKGMVPLVEDIWPHVKRHIPNAKLTIIGGFYNMGTPDEQEKKWNQLSKDHPEITFTGVISQAEIADILSKSSWMIYPTAFPETFGISTLEALNYNVPVLTTNFGALEQTAIDIASYKIPYCVEPNSVFPNINKAFQVEKFVEMVVLAYNNPYLHQQKMYACNQVKDISSWDSVAKQWKQHFYKRLGQYLPLHDYKKVCEINARVREVFGTRFCNTEDNYVPRNGQRKIIVITPMYNAKDYIKRCIDSVMAQDYDNYHMVIIDDCSTDGTYEYIREYVDDLQLDMSSISLDRNNKNRGALFNQLEVIRNYNVSPSDIVVLLDGDDSLVNDNQIFHKINNIYKNKEIQMTYGSCWSMADNIPLVAQPYPSKVFEDKSFKSHKFNWNIPYTHLRTFKAGLIDATVKEKCQDEQGNYFKAGGDGALFYALIEKCEKHQVYVVSDILVNYNDLNPLNDYKVNGEEQTKNANKIVENKVKSILIAIPTAKYVETSTMKSIYDLTIPAGCRTELQFFYGYSVSQVRNLIADWGKNYDYIFCVDSDIVLPKDALEKMVFAQKDVVSGVYIQRLPGNIPEIYRQDYSRFAYEEVMRNDRLFEIGACGFGCVLINSEVLRKIPYPHFVYKEAIDHANTLSEDVYFCMKAREHGFKIWCDNSIRCDHVGQNVYSCPEVGTFCPEKIDSVAENIKKVAAQDLLPKCHADYLYKMKRQDMIYPDVIYDIGACVGHWGRHAKECWDDAKIYAFEANGLLFENLYDSKIYDQNYNVVLSDEEKEVKYYNNPYNLGGNSYYKENTNEYNESHIEHRKAFSLDQTVELCNVPLLPDLIKIDVQGAELDILKGAEKCLANCNDIIVECQHTNYNEGAPKFEEVKTFLESKGFKLVSNFCRTDVDGDYHFRRIK